MTNLPDIPVKWIEKQIEKSIGMEHAMWTKLLRRWENYQLRKDIRKMDNENR